LTQCKLANKDHPNDGAWAPVSHMMSETWARIGLCTIFLY